MHGLESGGEYDVTVAAHHNRKARHARLSIRFAKVALEAPKGKKELGPMEIYAVLAREEAAPEGEAPLEWLLLTTVAVESFEQARKILSWYTVRWGIEDFHRTLKSGCPRRLSGQKIRRRARRRDSLARPATPRWHLHRLARRAAIPSERAMT
jgi:hypothetical protein